MTDKDGLPNKLFRPSRRQIMTGMASAGLLMSGQRAFGQAPKRIIVPEGEFTPLPIAIPNFVAGTPADAEVGVGVSQVITNNLKRSGLFAPIDPAAFIEKVINIDAAPNFQNWEDHQRAGAGDRPHDAATDGRLQAEFRLWDVTTAQQLTRPPISHLAGILAADRAHHLRPDLRAPDWRERLFR